MSDNEPSKTSGQFHTMKGSAAEAIGNITGSDSMERSGKEERAKGDAEYKAAQAKGYAEGTKDRILACKDSVMGSLTGDRTQQESGNMQNEKGKVQQNMNMPN